VRKEETMAKAGYGRALAEVVEQQGWITQCGGNLTGYIEKYGRAADPEHFGNGGEAIFKADMDELRKREQRARALAERRKR
jgi:hypothetical protein